MRGMEQGEARRRAKELGGIALSARNPERCKPWRLGGWPLADDVWIVISLDHSVILDDGEEQNYSSTIWPLGEKEESDK